MKKLIILFCFILTLILLSYANAQDYVPGEIMIDIGHQYLPISPVPNPQGIIETGLPSIDSLNVLYGVYDFERPVYTLSEVNKGILFLKFPDSLNVDQVLSSFLADIHINMGSLNYIGSPCVTPSDYYFPQQWGLSKIKCTEAWRYTNGSPSIVIQILDGGTDYGHPDLVHNIWQNLGEDMDEDGHTIEWDPSQNKWILDPGDFYFYPYDDDGNYYCDDLVGFDFRDEPCEYDSGYDPQPTQPENKWDKWYDHGDGTAGTMAAVTNNRISSEEAEWVCELDTNTVAGTSWFSKIMIARMQWDSHAINAIDYAMNNGAKIISMSWGHSGDNPLLHAKLDEAWSAGLLLIAAAGNDSSTIRHYPAAYENVIAVAGTDNNDVKAPYSNWGTWVDVCAPWSSFAASRAYLHWNYYCYVDSFAGTSASAPFVSGVAALVWTCNQNATNAEVRDAILNTADYIYGIPENWPYYPKLGSGRVNALEAVKVFRPVPPASGDCNTDGIVNVGDVVYLVGYLYRGGNPPDPLCVGDVNDDGIIDVGDVLYLRNYLYGGGPPPLDGCD